MKPGDATAAGTMDWDAWTAEQRPAIAAICRGEPDPMPTTRPLKEAIAKPGGVPVVTMRRCIHVAAEVVGVTPAQITGPQQGRLIVTARDIAVKLRLGRPPHIAVSQIAETLNRDHSSICTARDRVNRRVEHNIEPIAGLYRRALKVL